MSKDIWTDGWKDGWGEFIHFSKFLWLLVLLVMGSIANSL